MVRRETEIVLGFMGVMIMLCAVRPGVLLWGFPR